MNRILIIEDDKNILELEKDYLEANSFEVYAQTDGIKGMNTALKGDFDLIILDIMLPEMNGFEICKKIREAKDVPVILVSAKKEDFDKIKGLELGADDYIVKPFSPGELVARVKAHINRYKMLTQKADENVLEFGDFRLNKNNATAFIGDGELILTKKEFDLLFLLASNPEKVFTKKELFEKVWGYDPLGDTSTLTVHINRLREKIRDIDENSDFIKTIWSRGYKFT